VQTSRRSEQVADLAHNRALYADNAQPMRSTTAIGASDADGANLVSAPVDSLAVTARVLMVEARKKTGGDVERVLREAVHAGRMEEQRGLLEATSRQRREHLRVTNQKIVCGFIAEVEMAMQQGRGGLAPDEVWNLNSFTVCKIVDALNAAGYHAKGFRDPVNR
jgi:hypothetical protein